jgi:NADH dehydrogenase
VEADGTTLPYDHLVVATGTENNYFGHQEWAARAPGLKSIEDATEIRSRVISAFEAAEGSPDTGDALGLLTFVVIGGGPTGVELAGAVAELARDTLRHEFRRIAPERARVMLLEAADRILLSYPPKLSEKAASQLARLGVQVRTGCKVEDIPEGGVRVRMRMGEETIAARTVLWSAGMRATPLGELLREQTGVELDRLGRVTVDKQLSLPAHPEVFVIGDLALYHDSAGDPLPATAPVALQQGRYVARLIRARLLGKRLPPFHFRDRGQLATVGRSAAVAVFPHLRLWGFPAWIIWLFVHLMQLIRYENRLLVFIQWLFNYVTRNRSARLITDYTSRDSSASTR